MALQIKEGSMATESLAEGRVIETRIPARFDRLPWTSWHSLVLLGLGTVGILDGLEVTIVGSIASRLTEAGSGIKINESQIGVAASTMSGWGVGCVAAGGATRCSRPGADIRFRRDAVALRHLAAARVAARAH
jgi:hypothetical protein